MRIKNPFTARRESSHARLNFFVTLCDDGDGHVIVTLSLSCDACGCFWATPCPGSGAFLELDNSGSLVALC
jgi:hypothetical protein